MSFQNMLDFLKKLSTDSYKYKPLSFPPPYESMLAINSDVEWTSWDIQVELLHEFGARNLEVAFSYWMFSSPNVTWSLFDEDLNYSKYAKKAIELAKAGILDTNHSFGGRKHAGGCSFDRGKIESAYGLLNSEGIKTSIYTNHGGIYDVQNIGGIGWATYQQGDLPGEASYHLDLTLDQGYKFFWCDPDYTVDRYFLASTIDDEDSLFVSGIGRDGRKFLRFRRFLGDLSSGPSIENFHEQVHQLISNQKSGYAVIFQHLGVERNEDGTPKSCLSNPLRSTFYDALNSLENEVSRGKILVTTTEKLLNHALIMLAKPWSIKFRNKVLFIDFHNYIQIDDLKFEITETMLHGWCIELDNSVTDYKAYLNGKELKLEKFIIDNSIYLGFKWKAVDINQLLDHVHPAIDN